MERLHISGSNELIDILNKKNILQNYIPTNSSKIYTLDEKLNDVHKLKNNFIENEYKKALNKSTETELSKFN